jgi:dTDP-4-amino-4,6-dideoxygalactose transaminase
MAQRRLRARPESVPFVDLRHAHEPLKARILDDISGLIDQGTFINGPPVAEFESAWAAYCGTRFCVGVASGLDALRLSLLAAGLEAGDEVVVPASTVVATLEAVIQTGGIPVVADVGEHDYGLDPAAAEAAVSPRTRFLLPVHLYGQMADVRALEALAGRSRLDVVEDACQAHGAVRDGVRAGSAGVAAAFSFYPAKNLGAIGDAGALVTDDDELAATARALREHGQRAKYEFEREGYTARLDTIHALVLLRKLPFLDGWTEQRRAAADAYLDGLAGVGDLRLPPVPARSEPVWHLFVVRTADPHSLADFLRRRGIATGRHYPEPVHLSAPYRRFGYRPGAFPVAEALARESLSLPLFPGISESQLEAVVGAVTDFFHRG